MHSLVFLCSILALTSCFGSRLHTYYSVYVLCTYILPMLSISFSLVSYFLSFLLLFFIHISNSNFGDAKNNASEHICMYRVWFWRKIYQRCNPDLFSCYLQLVETAWPIKNNIWKLLSYTYFQTENKPDHLPIFFLLDTILWVVQWTLDRPDLQSFGQGLFVCFAQKETTAKLSVAPSLLYTLGMLDL